MGSEKFILNKKFKLESGDTLPNLEIAYQTWGTLNADKSNVIWVCHALTANSDVFDWWAGMFGSNKLYNPEEYFIVCANNLGSCYGTTGPLSINENTGNPWYTYFPKVTIRDLANSLETLRIHLNIEKIHTIIGGSLGGQVAQEWVLQHPTVSDNLILLATNAFHSSWGIAFNESQRLAIRADRTYIGHSKNGGEKGLQAARSIALLSYRTYQTYNDKLIDKQKETNLPPAITYQRHQGIKLTQRFDAYSYVVLTETMDSHNIAKDRDGGIQGQLEKITQNTLVIGIDSDILFPINEQKILAEGIPNAQFVTINSDYGHDGFLIETTEIAKAIQSFYINSNKSLTA